MEKVLGGNNYTQLVEWQHPRDQKLKYSYTKFPDSNGEEDGVSVCPVVKKNGVYEVLFATHIRPQRLESPKSHGLSLEVVAGYNKDKDAQGLRTEENAKKETQEELGLEIKTMHRIADAVGSGSGSKAEFVAECILDKEIKPKEPDMTELAIMSVPLEDAITFINETARKGIDIQDSVYKQVAEAQNIFRVKNSSNKNIKPKLQWTIAGNNPNELQKDGLKELANKKEFLPEAAVELKKKQGFFARSWQGFKDFITLKWLFARK